MKRAAIVAALIASVLAGLGERATGSSAEPRQAHLLAAAPGTQTQEVTRDEQVVVRGDAFLVADRSQWWPGCLLALDGGMRSRLRANETAPWAIGADAPNRLGVDLRSDSTRASRAAPLRQPSLLQSCASVPRNRDGQQRRSSRQGAFSWPDWRRTSVASTDLGTGAGDSTSAVRGMDADGVRGAVRSDARDGGSDRSPTELDRTRSRTCRFQWVDRGTWTAREERRTASCVVSRWPVEGGLAKFIDVGQCESGWFRFASNGGNYLGLFQHDAESWFSRVRWAMPDGWRVGPWTNWANSRAQIVTTARMVHAGGWSPWSCA
jgi:hypothetical protein